MITIQTRPIRHLLRTSIFLCLCALARAVAPAPFADGERVLFLGDSITRAGGWHSQIALFYETRFPDRRIAWLNVGISGDTSAGAVQRLQWDVFDRKPSTVVIMLGMNDAARDDLPVELGMGEVGSDQRVAEFAKNMRLLVEKLQAAKVKTILCTPSLYDATAKLKAPGNPAANEALTKMAAICRDLATEFGVALVDFNGPMNAITTAYQKTNPAFTLIGGDRVHPGALGNTLMACIFLDAQGLPGLISNTVIDAAKGELKQVENAALSELKVDNGTLSFTLAENALPMPLDPAARQALRLSPENELLRAMAEMDEPQAVHRFPGWDAVHWRDRLHRQTLTVTGLPEGEYELLIDEQPVGRWGHDDLGGGVNLSGLRLTPQYQQAENVASAHGKQHGTASSEPRMIAFIRRFCLDPAGIDEADQVAVNGFLEKLINDPSAKDNYELGGFAQAMAKRYLQYKPKEHEMAAAIAAADDEIHKLNKPVSHHYELRPLTHPLSLEQRQAAFEARQTPEQVENTARAFLDLLILDGPGLLRSNLRMRKGFQTVADLAKADKPVEALNAWRDYFFEKLRNPMAYGLSLESVDPYKGLINLAAASKTLAQAEELMQGKFAANTGQAMPMPPGTVWLPVPKGGAYGAQNPWRPSTFQPLAVAYLLTGERRFLDQWIAYMDDWAMHEIADDRARPTDLPDVTNSYSSQIPTVYRTLAGIARMQPMRQADFPADTLARILGKLIRVYPPSALVYFETNPQNWTPHNTPGLMAAAAWIDEFKAADYIFNRARRRQENYATNEGLPDGSETEHAVWYNRHVYTSNVEAMEFAALRRSVPSYQRPPWERALSSWEWEQDRLRTATDRGRYLLQMITPQSQNPLGNRNDQRSIKGVTAGDDFDLLERAPDLRILTQTLNGNTAVGVPSFTMSAFPYSGSWLMRTGWEKDAGYAHFFSSPYPTGGHALPGMKSNNSFYLSQAGQDLLVNGGFGNYSYCRSPLRVDGLEQFAHAGIGHGGPGKGHKGFAVGYLDPQPPAWRAHSSVRFDLAEGIYEGPYGESVDDHHDNKAFTPEFLAERARTVLTGVRHHRQVIFVKDPGLWIVVDRLNSFQPHEYSLDWFLPVSPVRQFEGKPAPRYSGKTFAPEKIVFDDAGQTLSAAGDGMPNLVIRHFGPQQAFSTLRIDGEAVKDDYTLRYKLYDFWRASSSWKSTGNDLMVSLIEVIPDGQPSRLSRLEKVSGGFQAHTASGARIGFVATLEGRSELKLGDNGLVLGDESYEFQGEQRTPIYCPIAPVKIEPARNVIAGPETVTLASATPNVEIRYTLDGSEPNVLSRLYASPFQIDNTATVQARAFRPGVTQMPGSLAGTHATVTAVAHYTLQTPLAPVTAQTQPGLKAEYAEGDWKDLVFFPERMKPLKTYGVKKLFERCLPNVEKVFGWTYAGFLDVPEDGVYTFLAPEELVTAKQEAGYALRLFVGQEMNAIGRATGNLNEWDPVTTRHAYGTWSIALKKGLQPFKAIYVDYRTDAVERLNHPGLRLNTIWNGQTPDLKISGPGMEPQPIPDSWFKTQLRK